MTDDPHEQLARDDALGPLVERHGRLTLSPAEDPFERLVVSICRQQVSMASAAATRERLFDRVAVTPEGIATADPSTLRDAGLSAAKADYVRNAAEAFRDRGLDRPYFADHTDEEVLRELTDVTGIGPWTAKMFLMFGLGRPDVFPVEDLGVRRGMSDLFGMADDDRAAMRDRAEAWRPYRSFASLYLWQYYEDGDRTT